MTNKFGVGKPQKRDGEIRLFFVPFDIQISSCYATHPLYYIHIHTKEHSNASSSSSSWWFWVLCNGLHNSRGNSRPSAEPYGVKEEC